MSIKIGFLVDLMTSGGAERVASILCNEFCKTEDVTLIMISSTTAESFYKLNAKIHVVPLLQNANTNFYKKVCLLKKHLKNNEYDVLVSFLPNVNICAHFANLKTKIPHIVSERNNPYSDPQNPLKRSIKNYVFSKADGVVLQTNDASNYYKKIPSSKKIVISNPLFSFDNNLFRKDIVGSNKIVFVGRLEQQKNVPMAIKAFHTFYQTHPNTFLEIYGVGSEERSLKELTHSLGLDNKVTFKGNSNNWISETVDCAMFINTSSFEGLPNSLLEAACYGIPCIATDCPIGGSKEIINDRVNGLLCKTNDVEQLSSLMSLLYHNKTLVSEFMRNNKTLNLKFSREKIASDWLRFIKEKLQ